MRAIPTSKPKKEKTKPFVDNEDLFIQFHVNNDTNRLTKIEIKLKKSGKEKVFVIKNDDILGAWKQAEKWFALVTR